MSLHDIYEYFRCNRVVFEQNMSQSEEEIGRK